MSRVESIERKVRELSPEELADFRSWFDCFDAETWDREFEDDVRHGRLDEIADKALGEHANGDTDEL